MPDSRQTATLITVARWRAVPDWPYQVNNLGQIRRGVRVLKPIIDADGYVKVSLTDGERRRSTRVHTVILETFVGPCPVGLECRHLDGNRANNALHNLCWGTRKENGQDKVQHGRSLRGARNSKSKLSEQDAKTVRALLQQGVPGSVIAERFGVTRTTVGDIRRGRSWSHLGPPIVRARAYAPHRISDEVIVAVRAELAAGVQGQLLAERFGISAASVSKIKHNLI